MSMWVGVHDFLCASACVFANVECLALRLCFGAASFRALDLRLVCVSRLFDGDLLCF